MLLLTDTKQRLPGGPRTISSWLGCLIGRLPAAATSNCLYTASGVIVVDDAAIARAVAINA